MITPIQVFGYSCLFWGIILLVWFTYKMIQLTAHQLSLFIQAVDSFKVVHNDNMYNLRTNKTKKNQKM
jgi:hypothetical protein